jgi:hypothetical protein
MEPPFEFEGFRGMSKKKVEEYFEWYINEIPNRIKLLRSAYKLHNRNDNVLDYSSDSLKSIWAWYLKNVKIVPLSNEEYESELKSVPPHIRYCIPKKKIELGWVQIALDIGIYMALCMLNYCPKLKWGFVSKPWNLDSVNKPVLLGFTLKTGFDTSRIMSTLMSKAIDSTTQDDDLYNLFMVWTEYILEQ